MLKIRVLLYTLFLTATWEGILYVTIGGINFRPYEFILALLVLVIVSKNLYTFDTVAWLMLLYVMSGVPSLINSRALSSSLNTLFFQMIMVIIALSIRALLNTQTKLEDAIKVWVLVIANIVNLFGLLEFGTWAIGKPILPQFAPEFYAIARPYSVFIEPNFYGNFLVGQLGLMLVLWSTSAYRSLHFEITLSLLLAVALLILNQSRGPWIGLILAVSIFVLIRYIRRGKIPTRVALASVIFLYLLFTAMLVSFTVFPGIGAALIQRFQDIINPQEGAARARLYDIQLALQMFQRSPITGNGLGSWGILVGNTGRAIATPPRNIFIAWLAEKGIVGLLFGLAMIWKIVVRTKSGLRVKHQALRVLIWTCFTGWLTIFITFQFTYLEISPFYWIITGFLLAAQDLAIKSDNELRNTSRKAYTLKPSLYEEEPNLLIRA